MEIGVHSGFEDGQAAKLVGIGRLGIVVEGAADQHVETGVASLVRGGDEIGASYRSVLWADKDSGAAFVFPFLITAFGTDEVSRPTGEGSEVDLAALIRLLHTSRSQLFKNDSRKVVRLRFRSVILNDVIRTYLFNLIRRGWGQR